MRIVLTGGDGFIGKHLCQRLHKRGYEIIVVDNNITSKEENYDLSNVTHYKEGIETFDLNKLDKVDVIYHMASIASPLVYKKDFNNVYLPNVKGTENMIELAKRDDAQLFYFSTSEVYGSLSPVDDLQNGIVENHESISHLLTERSIYSTSKKMGEELVNQYLIKGGKGVIFRLFNVYGPNMDTVNPGYGRVMPNFMTAINANDPVTIFGDGTQVRSFLWIDDLLDALELIQKEEDLPHVLNIGNAEPVSINDLAEIFFKLMNNNTGITYKTMDHDDPIWRKPNCARVEECIDWTPKVSLQEGLKILLNKF